MSILSWDPATADTVYVDRDGVMHVPGAELPDSSLFRSDERLALQRARAAEAASESTDGCPAFSVVDEVGAALNKVIDAVECSEVSYLHSKDYAQLLTLFPAEITRQNLGGVPVEVFTPKNGVASKNRNRVLINLHGGAFLFGARTISKIESLPIATVGRIKVISIDYRQAPKYAFPAASEDVEAVYRELLKTYKAASIGIYGCSAGGLLTAESLVRFQRRHLPTPGAAGMFCAAASYWSEGDSGILMGATTSGRSTATASLNPYFKGVDATNALAFPARSPTLMAKFPPSLMISGTRDFALSSVVRTHEILVSHHIPAELHVWEGLGHGFFYNPSLPQSREEYLVVTGFFDRYLSR